MKYPIECPNCGGPLDVALVELDQEMKVCIDPQCGWEESDGDHNDFSEQQIEATK